MTAAREHDWQETGVTIDTFPSFPEERCAVCGAIAWGGSRTGERVPKTCPGDPGIYREWARQTTAAHNRRAYYGWAEIEGWEPTLPPLEFPSEWWAGRDTER
jgi:hypothetical protein